jgi:NAD(P)-dependent dehydrogenase (short-subunit alcohol dehydrogenase family)
VVAVHGTVDVLVNSAAVQRRPANSPKPCQGWRARMDTLFTPYLLLALTAWSEMNW